MMLNPLFALWVAATMHPIPEGSQNLPSTLGAKPPKDAFVLFDGRSTSAWQECGWKEGLDNKLPKEIRWPIKNGALEVNPRANDICSKRKFGDYRLHIEFRLPLMRKMKGQNRANSGVYSHGLYEIQVLDSWMNPTYKFGGCGALYGQKDPDVGAIQPPQTWNTYDIEFRAPRFDANGKLTGRPRITVWHNGKLIHKDVEIVVALEWAAEDGPIPKKGPILLQNHWCPVRYRNIWVLPR